MYCIVRSFVYVLDSPCTNHGRSGASESARRGGNFLINGVRVHLKPGVSGTGYLGSRSPLEPIYQYRIDKTSGTEFVFAADIDTVFIANANNLDDNDTDPGEEPGTASGDIAFQVQFNAYCEANLGMARHGATLSVLNNAADQFAAGGIVPGNWYYQYLIREISNMMSPEKEPIWFDSFDLVPGKNICAAPDLCQPLYLLVVLTVDPLFKFTKWYGEADLGNYGNFMEQYAPGAGVGRSASVPTSWGETRYLNCLTQRFKLVQT